MQSFSCPSDIARIQYHEKEARRCIFQKCSCVFTCSCRRITAQDDWDFIVFSGTYKPYIRLAFRPPAGFLEDLNGCFICHQIPPFISLRGFLRLSSMTSSISGSCSVSLQNASGSLKKENWPAISLNSSTISDTVSGCYRAWKYRVFKIRFFVLEGIAYMPFPYPHAA